MKKATVVRIEINADGRILVYPDRHDPTFQYVYRAGAEVSWDAAAKAFSGQSPRTWSYIDWYRNIVSAARSECGVELVVSAETRWINVPVDLMHEIAEVKF